MGVPACALVRREEPVPVLVQRLGLSEADAAKVVEARDRMGGFSSAEEVIAYTDLSSTLVDGARSMAPGDAQDA